jgi:hypothetical protein
MFMVPEHSYATRFRQKRAVIEAFEYLSVKKIFENLRLLCWVSNSDWLKLAMKISCMCIFKTLWYLDLLPLCIYLRCQHCFNLFLLHFLFLLFPFTFLLFPLFSDLAPQTAWAYIQGSIFFDAYRLFKFVYCLLG